MRTMSLMWEKCPSQVLVVFGMEQSLLQVKRYGYQWTRDMYALRTPSCVYDQEPSGWTVFSLRKRAYLEWNSLTRKRNDSSVVSIMVFPMARMTWPASVFGRRVTDRMTICFMWN